MLDLQNKIPQLVTNSDSLYTNIAKLTAIYTEITSIAGLYDDIKVGGTNYTNTTAIDLNLADSKIAIVAADLQLGNLSKIKIVKDSITSVNTVSDSIANVNTVAPNISSVNTVAPSIASVNTVAPSIASVNTVATNIANVNTNATNIVAIQDASANAATATTQAGISTTQASSATTSANTATTQAGISTAQAVIATTQAGIATTKANSIIGLTTQASTGAAGSLATVSYNPIDGKMTFSIPQGIQGIRGEAFTVNSVGLATDKPLYDAQIKGFSFLAIDSALIYFKLSNTSGDWSIGAPFGKGDQGNTGLTGTSITSIAFLSTTHGSGLAGSAGGTDTYRITMSDANTYNFLIYNGLNGVLINDVTLSLVATWSSQKSSDQLALKAPINSPTFTGTVGGITASMVGAPSGSGTSSGTNTGDNAVNSLYSGLVTNATHTGDATGDTALTVVAINGTSMAGLATGVLKNTTGTGVPSIAVAGTDYVAPGTATTFTAQQTFKEVKDTVFTITDAAAFEIDPANGSIQTVTLGASRTPAATNFEAGQVVLLGINDGTAYTITWTTVAPTWVKPGGTASAPTLATTGFTWVMLWKIGSTLYASEVGKP
jgi:hypothetical protein